MRNGKYVRNAMFLAISANRDATDIYNDWPIAETFYFTQTASPYLVTPSGLLPAGSGPIAIPS